MLALRRWTQVRGVVHAHADRGREHRWLEIAVPASFEAPEPGQFVQILLVPPSPVLLPRPMSVAAVSRRGAPGRAGSGRLIGFLYSPVGAGTRALAALGPGDALELLGPLGQGFPLDEPGTPVLIAGGRGVAPLLFAADVLAGQGRCCEFLFGARSAAQLVGLDEARERLTGAGGRLHLCTDDGSRGLRGNVVELLEKVAPRVKAPLVLHACGPHGMLQAVARWGLAHRTRAHLAMESVMACGTGVCRGCPLPRSAAARDAFDPDRTPSLFGNREDRKSTRLNSSH